MKAKKQAEEKLGKRPEAAGDKRIDWPALSGQADCQVQVASSVVRAMHQHARYSMRAEVCGVLIGEEVEGGTRIEASIPGDHAAQGGAHVTFTQETWEHIYKVKDEDYPEKRIVGWYHSHPGFGIFLSQQDRFIHENFFAAPFQVAWVYDPHSEEEGCFGWVEGKLMRLGTVQVVDPDGNQEAEAREEPDEMPGPPAGDEAEDGEDGEEEDVATAGETGSLPNRSKRDRWRRRMVLLFAMAVVFAAGVVAGLNLLPRTLVMYSFPDGRLLSEAEMQSAVERALDRQRTQRQQGGQPNSAEGADATGVEPEAPVADRSEEPKRAAP